MGWILRIYPWSRGIWLDQKRARSCMISRNKAGLKLAGGSLPLGGSPVCPISIACAVPCSAPCRVSYPAPARSLLRLRLHTDRFQKKQGPKAGHPGTEVPGCNGGGPVLGWLLWLYPCCRGIRSDSIEGEIQRSRSLAGLKLVGGTLPSFLCPVCLLFSATAVPTSSFPAGVGRLRPEKMGEREKAGAPGP